MNLKHLEKYIAIYKPLKDINTIIIETNKIFHKFDAKYYDTKHPEIFEHLPLIYIEMCKLLPFDKKLRILDFGCGTGFEAIQLLNNLKNIELLCCYDISDEMLNICKQKIKSNLIIFVNAVEKIPDDIEFNVLVTNSLLHHLPQPLETINHLNKFLSNDCFYIMGHEGSVRYYKNNDIQEINKNDSKKDLIIAIKNLRKRKINPDYFKENISIPIIEIDNPYSITAVETVDNGLFELLPPNDIIDKIVDCYVPHDILSANEGQGFDFKNIELYNEWKLIYSKTYNFLNNNIPYHKLNAEDKSKYDYLEEKYPDDGINFCCMWGKKSIKRKKIYDYDT